MIKENVVLDVDTEKSSSLEVLFQDEIQLEFNVPLIYVKSGEEDIKQYVENVVKPDFAVYVNDRKAAIATAAEAGVDDIAAAEKSAENDLDAFLQEEIKTELNNYVDTTVKSSLDDYGEELTAAFNENAADKTTVITESAAAAADSATAAANSETAASGSAAEALSSAAAASGSAEIAESWAVGVLTERPEGSAKYWAENAASLTDGAVNMTNISNCLTEVPQISWRMSGNNVIFAAGTKAYKPDGTVITFASEKTADFSGALLFIPHYAYADDAGNVYTAQKATSSTLQPSSPDVDDIWFDTANNVIKRYDGEAWSGSCSFPLIYMNGLLVTSISVIAFGGGGFIGNTIFVLPGVKGLVPNGRKADGRLNNTAFTVTTPLTYEMDENVDSVILLNGSSLSAASYSGSLYDAESNTNGGAAAGYVEAGNCAYITSTVVTKEFSLNQAFHAVDYAEFKQDIEALRDEVDTVAARLPAGFIAAWPGNTPPDGWLVCNGATVSRTTYADLFAAIGTTFGAGDGSTTFKLPDYQGDFLRGYLSGTSSAIGTRQAEGLPNITGQWNATGVGTQLSSSGCFKGSNYTSGGETYGGDGIANTTHLKFSAANSNGLYGDSSHVTPRNNAVKWCIKY